MRLTTHYFTRGPTWYLFHESVSDTAFTHLKSKSVVPLPQ